ncbi:MAG: hypothetical protein IPM64_03605 [Phycisphaerales bacterium]|nr:hypothetical protein [Phycisphaerales bacterium]
MEIDITVSDPVCRALGHPRHEAGIIAARPRRDDPPTLIRNPRFNDFRNGVPRHRVALRLSSDSHRNTSAGALECPA